MVTLPNTKIMNYCSSAQLWHCVTKRVQHLSAALTTTPHAAGVQCFVYPHTQTTECKFKHIWWDRSKSIRTALMEIDPHCSCWRKRQSSLSPTSISKTFSARVGRLLQTSPTDWFVLRLHAKAAILWIGHLFAICHANSNCPLVLQLIYNYML